MRPKIHIATEGLEKSLFTHLKFILEDKGLLSETELWEESLAFFSPNLEKMTGSLIKSYKLSFGRKIGEKTAKTNILNNLRLIVSKIKKSLLHTHKPVIAGGKRFGRIFYSKGHEGQIQTKVRELVKKGGGHQWETLKNVKKGPVRINPSNKRAVHLLEYYGLIEVQKIGAPCAVSPGFKIVNSKKSESHEAFPTHFKIWKPFAIETWVLRDGPEKIKLKFELAAWDPVNKLFYLALNKKYISLSHLKTLREKQIILGLPTKLKVFCNDISESAKKYAEKWGIEIETSSS